MSDIQKPFWLIRGISMFQSILLDGFPQETKYVRKKKTRARSSGLFLQMVFREVLCHEDDNIQRHAESRCIVDGVKIIMR